MYERITSETLSIFVTKNRRIRLTKGFSTRDQNTGTGGVQTLTGTPRNTETDQLLLLLACTPQITSGIP